MAEEVNETLQEAGQLTIAGLSKMFSLPADFVLSVCHSVCMALYWRDASLNTLAVVLKRCISQYISYCIRRMHLSIH